MNITILGAGSVGGTLGRRWAQAGHQVTFGVRDSAKPEVVALLGQAGPNARAASLAEAAAGADVVVLATPWGDAASSALRAAGDLAGKILVDCTNPLAPGLAGLTHGKDDSGAEQVARWAPGARVVKAFNTTGYGVMADPRFGDDRSVMLVCGDDPTAKARVRELSDALGFDTVDFGPLTQARYLEPFAFTWIWLAVKGGLGRDIAWVLKRR